MSDKEAVQFERYWRERIAQEVRDYARERLVETEHPNASEDIWAALMTCAHRVGTR